MSLHTQYTLSREEPTTNSSFQEPAPPQTSYFNEDHLYSDNDFEPPCPFIAQHCPYPCCCCCAFSRTQRQQCAMSMLYNNAYWVVYLLIIAMTLTLLTYDLAHGNIIHDIKSEPMWFIIVDICCVTLMVFDVLVQIEAHSTTYWKSTMNVFDFSVVLLCAISIPVYFYVPDSDFILTVVLLLRFAAQLLRIVMVYKHHENRSAFMETTRADLVDFTGLESANVIDSAQGRSASPVTTITTSTYQNPSLHTIQPNGYHNGMDAHPKMPSVNQSSTWEI